LAADDILRLEEVVAGYGRETILNGLSFGVPRGAITTVIGPNGAGKSTAFKAAFGMLPVRSGRVVFDGREITNATPRRLIAAGICYVPQGRNIFPELSVLHNLELGGVAAPRGFDLEARMAAAMDRFPVLRRKAKAQASTLSGGEQKMLEIARGLMLDPRLMLIDEPSIGLSPILVEELFGLLAELEARGITILMIEQNAKRALDHSDHGTVLELGRTHSCIAAGCVYGLQAAASFSTPTEFSFPSTCSAERQFATRREKRRGTGSPPVGSYRETMPELRADRRCRGCRRSGSRRRKRAGR
jgi:branched-chain amino acid transport system ATP-binding protein